MSVVLTFHGIEAGRSPLLVAPELLAAQLDALVAAGATALTVTGLVEALQAGNAPAKAVALTFDDAYSSVVEHAAPLLEERGLVATVYCVAGRLGGTSDWPSQPPIGLRRPLASAADLAQLAASGWEIGAHGLDHDPLDAAGIDVARELEESKQVLEDATGAAVTSFCFPYGAVPRDPGPALVRAGYATACTTRLGRVDARTDPLALPRVDAHYLRRPALFGAVAAGRGGLYLGARGAAARARRLVLKDYA